MLRICSASSSGVFWTWGWCGRWRTVSCLVQREPRTLTMLLKRMQKNQLMWNVGAQAIKSAPKMAHSVPLIHKLLWLPVCFWVQGAAYDLESLSWHGVICGTASSQLNLPLPSDPAEEARCVSHLLRSNIWWDPGDQTFLPWCPPDRTSTPLKERWLHPSS